MFAIVIFDNFDPHYVLLAIATNIPVRHVTGFVIQCHIVTVLSWSALESHLRVLHIRLSLFTHNYIIP